jgi:type II secretory pathway component PulM
MAELNGPAPVGRIAARLREASPRDRAVLAFLVWVGVLTPLWVVLFDYRPLVALGVHAVGGAVFAGLRYLVESRGLV